MDIEKVLFEYSRAKTRRSQWEDLWEEIYELMLPMQEGFFHQSRAEENMELIYDETAIVSIQGFASRLQSGLVPNFSKWMRLIPGTEVDQRQMRDLQAELDDITSYIFEVLHNTNFSQASVESFLDLAVGTGNMLVQEDVLGGRLLDFQAVGQPMVYVMPGPGGTVDRIFRLHELDHIREAKQLWPQATFSDATKKSMELPDKQQATVVESVMRDWNKKDNETWDYDVILMKDKEKIFSDVFKGEGSNPWLNFRWSNRPGEVYGRGPAILALPATRVANLVTKLTMENADIQIGGMWQVDDDGTVNVDTIEIASGTVIPRTPGTGGLESIAPGGRIEFGDLLLSRTQEHIRDIFFSENLGSLDKTPISATEASIRTNRLAEVMGSSFGRLQYEYVTPLIKRIVYLLKQQGKIEIPRINGREVGIVATSPLARGMKIEQVQNITNFYGTLQQLMGPQQAALYVKPDKMVNRLGSDFDVPADILTTEAERAAAAKQMGEAMGAAEAAQPGGGQQVIDMASQLGGGGGA
jgi:hypothetical protein